MIRLLFFWNYLTCYGLAIFLFALTICCKYTYSSPEQPKGQIGRQPNFSHISKYNVIIVVLSTLRADHLSCYGYKRPTSPNIDNLAAEGIVFEQAISQSNWTLPSITSLFTSKYVITHNINNRDQAVSYDELMLAEILKFYGYKTAAFTGGLDLNSMYRLNQGFDVYFDNAGSEAMGGFREIIPAALGWLVSHKNDKFFLFLHTYDVHTPYHAPQNYENMYDPDYKGVIDQLYLDYNLLKRIRKDRLFLNGEITHKIRLTPRDIEHIIAHYDGSITYADSYIGELLKKLKELDLLDKTIIISTADHGEELYDHGSFDRYGSNNIYEEVIHVPLIIRHPGIDAKGKRIYTQVQLIDIMPTILDFLGISINKEAQGSSLVPLIEGKASEDFNRYVFSEGRENKRSLRTKKWKLVCFNNDFELYNLKKDSKEQNNLSGEHPDKVYELYQIFLEWYRTMKNKDTSGNEIQLSEEAIKDLKEAGYW